MTGELKCRECKYGVAVDAQLMRCTHPSVIKEPVIRLAKAAKGQPPFQSLTAYRVLQIRTSKRFMTNRNFNWPYKFDPSHGYGCTGYRVSVEGNGPLDKQKKP